MAYDLLRPVPLLLLANAAFTVGLAAYVAGFRQRTVTRWLVVILAGAAVWSLADGVRLAAPTTMEVLFWNKLTYVGAALLAPGSLLFTAAFTDRDRWLARPRVALLFGVSAAMLLAVYTNQLHGLWRPAEVVTPGTAPPVLDAELGPAHLAWVAWVLVGLVPIIAVFLVKEFRATTRRPVHRRQVALVALGFTGPVALSTLFVVDATRFDFTPFGFTLFGLALTVAIARYRMLDIVSIARDTVVEAVDSGVLVLDRDDRIVDANPQAARIVAEGDPDTLLGRDAASLLDDETVSRLAATSDHRSTIEATTEGERRHYQVSASTVTDAGGFRLGRVVIFSDVSQTVEREQRLVEQTEALERKNEQLDEFASVLSHDLQNPLSVASLRLEQVETDDEAELAAARDALERIDRMTEQLLTLARAGAEIDTTERVELAHTARRAWEAVSEDGATLSIGEDLDPVEGSPTLVVELLENLFRNALEHARPDGADETDDGPDVADGAEAGADDEAGEDGDWDSTLVVTVGSLADGRGFFVADDGVGVEEAERERIFDHGYSSADGGTGYGLAIVQDIAEAHGWTVDVTTSSAGGARFEIRTGCDGPGGADDPAS